MADIRDILELEQPAAAEINKDKIMGTSNKQYRKFSFKPRELQKRPEGINRELYALLYTDNKDGPPLLSTDTGQGYKHAKAKLGMRRVRPWKWMPFCNPARKDGAMLYHWRRVADEGKDYAFAKFNKTVPVPTYSDLEYQEHLHSDNWTRSETDHLFDLCRQFDLRFPVIQDRWDRSRFAEKSVEDLKQRYYSISHILKLTKLNADADVTPYVYDADHERRRKEQLIKLYDRTPEQLGEEQRLLSELRKIEARKRERDRKTQDLQKLITAADSDARKQEKKKTLKKLQQQKMSGPEAVVTVETTGIRFPDYKASGVALRSQRMKLPSSVGQKKAKAIEQMLQELGIDVNPMATEDICGPFNELRSDLVLLYELKLALATCEFELQTLRHQYEALAPGKTIKIPSSLSMMTTGERLRDSESPGKTKSISEVIDVVGGQTTPSRKRKAALEQGNVLRKIKNRV